MGCATFDETTLGPFNERVIDAIRTVDPETLIFYEPLVTFDFSADSKLPDTGDPAAGFSFHNYCLPGALGGPGSGPGSPCRSRSRSSRSSSATTRSFSPLAKRRSPSRRTIACSSCQS